METPLKRSASFEQGSGINSFIQALAPYEKGAITIETSQALSSQPSKLAATIGLMQSAGFLQFPRSFSCGHFYGNETDAREGVSLKFSTLIPQESNSITITFYSDGVVDLSAFPTKHGVPWWVNPVLIGTYPTPTSELLAMIEGSLEVIAGTLRLYSTSQPTDDYGPLMQVWQSLNPKLLDTAERLKELQAEGNPNVPEAPVPWWQFWHNF